VSPMITANKKNAILDRWAKTLERWRDHAAVFHPDGSVSKTFAQIEADVEVFSRRMNQMQSGSVVAIRAGNSVHWPAILLACFRRELIPLPVGRHMAESEFGLAIRSCDVSAVLEISDSGLEVVPIENSARKTLTGIEFFKLTSGTTAAPRAIAFLSRHLVADCDNVCTTMGITAEDRNFGVIPFSHSYGFSNLVTPLICRGVPLIASQERMPRAILNDLLHSRATVFPGMPVFFQAFAAMPDVPGLGNLRLCISAGAPLPAAMAERFSAKFGKKIHTFYGSSECGGISYDRSGEVLYEDGYVGMPMEGVSIERLDEGESSRIRILSRAVGNGYYPVPDVEQLSNGIFIPPDLIRETQRGMYVVGRASDIINVAGRKLNPLEVESQIMRLPGVRHVVVFGVPSSLRNEEPVACVAAEEGLTKADLMERCRAVLSPWQVPKDLWLLREIPVNERGKVNRRDLVEAYLAR
jgi:long-chain acyl-CoA synthetase